MSAPKTPPKVKAPMIKPKGLVQRKSQRHDLPIDILKLVSRRDSTKKSKDEDSLVPRSSHLKHGIALPFDQTWTLILAAERIAQKTMLRKFAVVIVHMRALLLGFLPATTKSEKIFSWTAFHRFVSFRGLPASVFLLPSLSISPTFLHLMHLYLDFSFARQNCTNHILLANQRRLALPTLSCQAR